MRHELKVFHSSLADEVRARLGPACPCCRFPMVKPRRRNATAQNRRDRPSVAHNVATAFGGNPEVFVIACVGCNQDQRHWSFRQWANSMTLSGDRRAGHVAEVADIVEEWLARTGTPAVLRRPKT